MTTTQTLPTTRNYGTGLTIGQTVVYRGSIASFTGRIMRVRRILPGGFLVLEDGMGAALNYVRLESVRTITDTELAEIFNRP